MYIYLKYTFVFLFFLTKVYGQRFVKISEITSPPGNIIISNYFQIALSANESNKLLYDVNNVDTYTQILQDERENIYHILYQTDFSGHIKFMALSNNLTDYFKCNNFPLNKLYGCFKKSEDDFLPSDISNKIISCIIARLNSCKE